MQSHCVPREEEENQLLHPATVNPSGHHYNISSFPHTKSVHSILKGDNNPKSHVTSGSGPKARYSGLCQLTLRPIVVL